MSTKFEKGQSGNPAGRKKGTPNRTNYEIKIAIQNILDTNISQMESDLKKLNSKDRINVILKLADLVIPKVQSTPPDDSQRDFEHQKLMQNYLRKKADG